MTKELIESVKKQTWLFTDKEIIEEFNKMQNYDFLFEGMKNDAGYTTLYLYKNKGSVTKEEYTSEVMNYLYQESLDSKEEIDKIVNKNLDWFYSYFEDVENTDYFHAVQFARNTMLSLLHY